MLFTGQYKSRVSNRLVLGLPDDVHSVEESNVEVVEDTQHLTSAITLSVQKHFHPQRKSLHIRNCKLNTSKAQPESQAWGTNLIRRAMPVRTLYAGR